jgi:hypothetical protein
MVFLFGIAYLFNAVPWVQQLGEKISSDTTFADLTYLAAGVWALALFLMIWNLSLYRILEGYTYPFSHISAMAERHRLVRKELNDRFEKLYAEGNDSAASPLKRRLTLDYPPMQDDVLPTLFGNRIRAFERYSNEIYGADGVTLWPRLLTVVSKDFGEAIADAQAQVNCMMNLCFVALALGIAGLIRLLFEAFTQSVPEPSDVSKLIAAVLIAPALAYATYLLASERVVGWGETVKSAYDCFLPKLAAQLGYAPASPESNREAFWGAIGQRFQYHLPTIADGRWPMITTKSEHSEE